MARLGPLLEVRPGPMSNKGGALMLRCIVDELGADYRLATETWIGPYASRVELGLFQKLTINRLGPAAGLAAAAMPVPLRRALGVVREVELAGLLDAAGYAYGDPFGPERAERAAAIAERWRSRRKPVILLPQAFGPFSTGRIQAAIHRLIAAATLVFVRDAESEAALQAIGITDPKVRRAPDFTLVARGIASAGDPGPDHAYVVPNAKMISHTPAGTAEQYRAFVGECVDALRRGGLEPRILVHETSQDRGLANELAGGVGGARIVEEEDPLRLKGLIGRAHVVIGSRYHALAAALSQAVPVVAVGWSHKYGGLLEDFGDAEALVRLPAAPGAAAAAVERCLDPTSRERLRGGFQQAMEAHRAATAAMWSSVRDALEAETRT